MSAGFAAPPAAPRGPVGAVPASELGVALTPDGRRRFRREGEVDLAGDGLDSARALGLKLGLEVRDEGGEALVLKD
jgi:hypothetical protein